MSCSSGCRTPGSRWPRPSSPVDNAAVNLAQAGSSVPVKFGLGGDQGLDVLAEDYPKLVFTQCDPDDDVDPVEATSTANTGLTYDAATDTDTYAEEAREVVGRERVGDGDEPVSGANPSLEHGSRWSVAGAAAACSSLEAAAAAPPAAATATAGDVASGAAGSTALRRGDGDREKAAATLLLSGSRRLCGARPARTSSSAWRRRREAIGRIPSREASIGPQREAAEEPPGAWTESANTAGCCVEGTSGAAEHGSAPSAISLSSAVSPQPKRRSVAGR